MHDIRRRLVAVIMVVLVLVAVCCLVAAKGCENFSFCGYSASELSLILSSRNKPQLDESVDCSRSAPVFNASFSADEINAALADYYAPLIAALDELNSEEPTVTLKYSESEYENRRRSVDTYLISENSAKYKLLSFEIIGSDTLSLPEFSVPDFMLCGGDFCDAYLRLYSLGIELDASRYYDEINCAEIYELYIAYLEALTGEETDCSAFRSDEYDELLQKAIAAGICEFAYDYEDDSPAGTYAMVFSSVGLFESAFESVCGNSSKTLRLGELAELTKLMLKAYTPSEDEAAQSWESFVSTLDLSYDVKATATRLTAAELFVRCYESGLGKLSSNVSDDTFDDTSDKIALKAYSASLMSSYPNYNCFSPYCDIWFSSAASIAQYYADTVYFGWNSDYTSYSASYGRAIELLGAVDEYLDLCGKTKQEPVLVDNSGDRDFYFTQYNSGRYSYMNCMPTITAMGVKWYYPDSNVKIADIRELYLPEYTEGWYSWQVMESLERYDVPYTAIDIYDSGKPLRDMICDELDKGNIVLTQMSEAGLFESGHCFVIYGYRKLAGSVVFLLHDPGVYDGTDLYGKRPGEAMELDSSYACWIIERIAGQIISVGDAA